MMAGSVISAMTRKLPPHLAGRLVSDAIRGQAERFDAFARLNHLTFPGGRVFRVPYTAMGALYYGLRDEALYPINSARH